jgi:hypothetical protein
VLLLLALQAVAAAPGAEVAIRVRADGRVDVRVTSAPLVAVLGRLGAQTGMKVAYQGPPPRRRVSLEVFAPNQAQAVLEVLEGLGVNYAVSMNPEGTRVLSLIVAAGAHASGAEPALANSEPVPLAEAEATTPLAEPQPIVPAGAPEPGEGPSSAPPLPAEFVPGGRATGQTPELGMPPFVLPDPPAVEAPGEGSPSEAPAENPPEPQEPVPMPTPTPTPGAEPSPSP